MKFSDVLDELAPELKYIMEIEKDVSFNKSYKFLTEIFENDEFIKKCDVDGKNLTFFLLKLYELGFYSGFKFAVNPEDLYPETIKKVYGE